MGSLSTLLEVAIAALAILFVASGMLFTSNGWITRKTVVVNYALFLILAAILWLLLVREKPSQALGGAAGSAAKCART